MVGCQVHRDDAAPAVLIVPNFSVGAVLAARFAEQAATWFESIEIVEAHHAGKAGVKAGRWKGHRARARGARAAGQGLAGRGP